MMFENLILEKKSETMTLWLNRPEVHNAFHHEMILELIQVFEEIANDASIRLLIIRGKGKSFCAGADLQWMKKATEYSRERNFKENHDLSKCLYLLSTLPKPTIASVHGAVFGGGNGLMAACDFVIAKDETRLSLSEVNLGLVPACISPYLLKRMGETKARQLMLTGKVFTAEQALNCGLVDHQGNESECSNKVASLVADLLTSGPLALAETKSLIDCVMNEWDQGASIIKTAELIADVRMTEEAQEGMSAFFEKRKPSWVKE